MTTYVVAEVNGAAVGAGHASTSASRYTAVVGTKGNQAVDGVGALGVVRLDVRSLIAVPVVLCLELTFWSSLCQRRCSRLEKHIE